MRRLLLGTVRGCPPAAWTLAALYLAAGAACLLAAAFPISPQASLPVALAASAGCLAVGTGLLAAGRRLPEWSLQGALALASATTGLLVANAHVLAGVLASAFASPWLGVWAGVFLRRRAALLHIALLSVALVAGLVAAGVPGSAAVGGLVLISSWTAVLVFARLTAHVWRHLETDPLTGVLNRAGLRRAAERARERATRDGLPLAVAAIDLDGFKGINDRYGHAAGDRLLAELQRSWTPVLRSRDLLGRQGGDEFVLVLPATTVEDARALLARLRTTTSVEWSAGVAAWHPGEAFEDSLERADRDLYRAKRARADGDGRAERQAA